MFRNSRNLIIVSLCLLMTACGYGREEDKEAERREELQELSQEMQQSQNTINTLKIQVRDSIATASEQDDSLAQEKTDKYRLLMAELEKAEQSYQQWRDEAEFTPENMNHEEELEYYDNEETRAEQVRQEMRSTIEYVESELQ